jgi:hypothetical protein
MITSLLKRCDTERFVTGNGEFPVCRQFIPVNVGPDLYHPQLARWKITGKNTAVVNGY